MVDPSLLSCSVRYTIVFLDHHIVQVTFAYDKKARKLHFKVRHANIDEVEFAEIFSGAVVVIGQKSRVLKAVGRTLRGRF